jgi:GT2 family glycosyltransferase
MLKCVADSQVAYSLQVPVDSRFVAWCAVAADGRDSDVSVEFSISIEAGGVRRTNALIVRRPRGRTRSPWRRLRVTTPEAGPARLTLKVRSLDFNTSPVYGLWHRPRVQWWRRFSELIATARRVAGESGIRGLYYRASNGDGNGPVELWLRAHQPSRRALQQQRRETVAATRLFTLVTLVDDAQKWNPRYTAASIRRQTYPMWEWVVVVPSSSAADVARRFPRSEVQRQRIHITSMPDDVTAADALNAALDRCRGEFFAVVGQADALSPDALYEFAATQSRFPDCDVVYSDEVHDVDDQHRAGGSRPGVQLKPDWSPEYLVASNYIGRLAMLRVAAVQKCGGFRSGFAGAEEWELLLRLSRVTSRIRRITRCLYYRRGALPAPPMESTAAVLREHCDNMYRESTVARAAPATRLRWLRAERPLVSIVVPNRDAVEVFAGCVRGLFERTAYPAMELIVVENGSTDAEVFRLYDAIEHAGRGRVIPLSGPFNFSTACNTGARHARGNLLLFLNNDIEVIDPEWLDELVGWALVPAVGAVGAKLLYPDHTIQHAGIVFGLGLVGHIFSKAHEDHCGPFGSTEHYRNYLAVTGACQMWRRQVFERIGGFDERFRLSFSDVVLCMEAWRAGYRVVYTPHARLVHHESYTRKRDDSVEDMELLARYLQSIEFTEDSFFHPELNAKGTIPMLRPPFEPMPRQVIHDYVNRVLANAVATEDQRR